MFFVPFLIETVIFIIVSTENVTVSVSDIETFILQQAELCPYISLCNLKNRSAPLELYHKRKIPCCSPCACDDTCEASGTCCPDFSKASLSKPNTEPPDEMSVEKCEKNQHGILENNEGYYMIAACPENFTDDFIKVHCESAFEHSQIKNLRDHIPLTEAGTGRTFKNIFCLLCHEGTDTTVEEWDVWLNCTAEVYVFLSTYYEETPLNFAETVLKDEVFKCNVAFKPSQRIRSFVEIESCVYDTIISTCGSNDIHRDLETLCAAYSWPVRVMDGVILTTYKNYACMLCNNMNFRENCYSASSKHFSVMLKTGSSQIVSTDRVNSNRMDNTTRTSTQPKTIKRKFQTGKGVTGCSEGKILDKTKGVCRNVTCPRYFFIEDGRCVPTFTEFSGISYSFFLEVILSDSIPDGDPREIENALFSDIDKLFQTQIGEGFYKFSLWGTEGPSTSSISSQTYFLLGIVDSAAFDGHYLEMLNFMYKLVTQAQQIPLEKTQQWHSKIVTVRFRFTTFLGFSLHKPEGPLRAKLYLLQPDSWTKMIEYFRQLLVLPITQSNLCYRIKLQSNGSDFQLPGRRHIRVTETKQLLQISIYEHKKQVGYFSILVCLDNAFNAVTNDVNYIFGKEMEHNVANIDNKKKHQNYANQNETLNNKKGLDTSTVALVGTMAAVGSFIALRILCSRVSRRRLEMEHENNTDSEHTENHQNNELQLSEIRQHNKSEETVASEGESSSNRLE